MDFIPNEVPNHFSQGLLLGPAVFIDTSVEKGIKNVLITSALDGGFG